MWEALQHLKDSPDYERSFEKYAQMFSAEDYLDSIFCHRAKSISLRFMVHFFTSASLSRFGKAVMVLQGADFFMSFFGLARRPPGAEGCLLSSSCLLL